MKVLFVADDGTQFDDKTKCTKYERVLKMNSLIGKELIMYDVNGREVSDPSTAIYVDIRTESARELFIEIAYYCNVPTTGIRSTGRYIFAIENKNEWGTYDALSERLVRAAAIFGLYNKHVNVTIDLGGCSLNCKVDERRTVKEVLDRAGIPMNGLKCNVLMGKRGFLLTDETIQRSFAELGVEGSCTLRLREEKEWE